MPKGGKGNGGAQKQWGKKKTSIVKRTVALHDLEELDNDLGARSDQDLTLAGLLGIVDGVEGIVENGSADHFGGIDEKEILKSGLEMRYLPKGKHMLDSEWLRSVESALSDPSTRVQPAHCRRGSSVSRNASQSRCVPNKQKPHDGCIIARSLSLIGAGVYDCCPQPR